VTPRCPARAVEALDLIARELLEAMAAGSTQPAQHLAFYEITKIRDAWLVGEPWPKRLVDVVAEREKAAREKAG